MARDRFFLLAWNREGSAPEVAEGAAGASLGISRGSSRSMLRRLISKSSSCAMMLSVED